MQEYKGLYYNDNTEQQYYEGGAHFRYKDLYQILEELVKKANSKKIPKTIKHVSPHILISYEIIFRIIT